MMAAAPRAQQAVDRLTREQQAVVDAVQPPGTRPAPPIVRVSAGAGTGKTTTMEWLVRRLQSKGHSQGSYLVFGKAAQLDAEKRIRGGEAAVQLPSDLRVTTVDACALACVQHSRRGADDAPPPEALEPLDDGAIMKAARTVCGDAITEFLKDVAGSQKLIRRCERQVAVFIQKTLTGFLQSARDPDGADGGFSPTATYPGRAYYPAQQWHERNPDYRGFAAPEGVPKKWYRGKWYLDQARLLWERMVAFEIVTFSSIMKLAQLGKLEIPGTFLLVDEAQDLNECQVDLLLQQHARDVHVFFVGDAAQSIYSFRGAKSGPLLSYEPAVDLPLTESFRFGPRIACVANTILFAKRKSPQTLPTDGGFRRKKSRLWTPYVIQGRSAVCEGQVGWAEQSSLLSLVNPGDGGGGRQQVTILAFGNATLFSACLPRVLASIGSAAGGQPLKVCVNGEGRSSGAAKWATMIKQVREFTRLWVASGPEVPMERWKGTRLDYEEFEGEATELTWKGAMELIEGQDLGKFKAAVALVCEHGARAAERVAMFEEHVLKQQYTQDEADIVLSTIHAAKGMEWDNVEICDDLVPLAKFRAVRRNPASPCIQTASVPLDRAARFDFAEYGDHINLWYVAVTRARRRLSLPPKFKEMVDVFRQIQAFASGSNSSEEDEGASAAGGPPESPPPAAGRRRLAAFSSPARSPRLSQAGDLPDSPATPGAHLGDGQTITLTVRGKRRDSVETFTLSRREARLIAEELNLSPLLLLMEHGRSGRWVDNAAGGGGGSMWVWDDDDESEAGGEIPAPAPTAPAAAAAPAAAVAAAAAAAASLRLGAAALAAAAATDSSSNDGVNEGGGATAAGSDGDDDNGSCAVVGVVTRADREKRARDSAEDLSTSPAAKQQR
jgi:hypothetical protein